MGKQLFPECTEVIIEEIVIRRVFIEKMVEEGLYRTEVRVKGLAIGADGTMLERLSAQFVEGISQGPWTPATLADDLRIVGKKVIAKFRAIAKEKADLDL